MRRLLLLTLAGLAVTGLLAACGGGGGGGSSSGQGTQAQAFTASVNQIAAKTADDTEPEDDATATTAGDDTVEPDASL
jgi:hypothetical protein